MFRFKRIAAALAVAAFALGVAQARADDISIKNAAGHVLTTCSVNVAEVYHPCHVMEGKTSGGAPIAVLVLGDGTVVTNGLTQAQLTTAALATDAKLEQVRALLAAPLAVTLSGVSTAANQATANGSLASIDGKVTGLATAAAQATAANKLDTVHNDLTKPAWSASGVTAVTGTLSSVTSSATFAPAAGRPFNLTLYATGSTTPGSSLGGSTVYLARSLDSGTTWLPITAAGSTIYSFTTLANETLYEAQTGVLYRLTVSVYGGTSMPFGFFQ
jgi:hypothetical protein